MFDFLRRRALRAERENLLSATQVARGESDWATLIRVGGELERLAFYSDAWMALSEGSELRRGPICPVWTGPSVPCRRLLIRRRIRHLGAELRNARFIAHAIEAVGEVTVAAEARLLPLLQRSFPRAQFIDVKRISDAAGCDAEASYERLALHFGPDRQTIEDSFLPLIPDRNLITCSPGIGLAWHSSNSQKLLPSLEDWAVVLSRTEVPLQSLQYQEEVAGIERLSLMSGREISRSMPVDQLIDVDGFASQVAGLAGVLTVSNTTAHMAGALGIHCAVILDDLPHLTWPQVGESPFYPTVRLIRRNGRRWTVVLEEAMIMLQKLMGQ